MGITNNKVAGFMMASLLLLAACKKDKGQGPENPGEVPPGISPVTAKDSNPIADQSIVSFNNTFLITSGSSQYYKESITVTGKDFFWRQALDIQMMEDVYLRTKSTAHKTLIKNLLNTFIIQNRDQGSEYHWDWNEFNDDLLWAAIAFARGYHITKEEKFLTQAKYSFNRAYDRGWDNTLGGGLWWDIRKEDKSGLSNNTAVITACYIYEATGEEIYLTKAKQIYDWMRATLYNPTTGAVFETIKSNGTIATDANVYNVGAFISAANHLYKITGIPSYFDDAKRSVDFVKNNKTTNGIMTHHTREGTWQSEFARGLGEFVRDNNLWSTYYTWMKQNADAAWATRRADLNIGWNQWITQTPKDNSSAVECIGTVIMQQITPATQPSVVENSTYRFTPRFNSDAALTISSLSTNTNKAIVSLWKSSTNQKFQISSVGRGYYRLIPQSQNASSLEVAGGNSANGTTIQTGATASSSSQLWKLVYDYAGFYKLKPRNAPLGLIKVGDKATDDSPCVLWKESNEDTELWFPEKQ